MSNAITASSTLPSPPNAGSSRWLWGAVGALGATTLALGLALVQIRTPAPAATVPTSVVGVSPLPDTSPANVGIGNGVTGSPARSEQKPAAAHVNSTQPAPRKIAIRQPETPAPVVRGGSPAPASLPPAPAQVAAPTAPPAPAAVCATCGTVVAVTPVERDGAPSGAGVVAGAVLGGLVGNQFGGGSGKTLATVAGAVGGGWAGNTVEKRMKKATVYLVDVRMDDGSGRRVETNTPVVVGAHVTINNGVLSQ